MSELSDAPHFHLTPYVLRMLRQHGIETIAQFFGATDRSLCNAANLKAELIGEIRQYLQTRFGPLVIDGLELKDQAISRTFLLQTGIKGLDELLQPGIMSGSLVELTGPVGVGKTIALTTLGLHAARHQHIRSLFVSTKRSFNGSRIYQLLKDIGCGQKECGETMQRIRNEDVTNASELVGVLKELLSSGHKLDYQILVIDSLAPLLYLFQGEHRNKGISIITEAMVLMRQIAERYNKIVFVESVVLSGDQSSANVYRRTIAASTISLNWPSTPSLRLLLSYVEPKPQTSSDMAAITQSSIRRIQLLKSTQHSSSGDSMVRLTTKGIV